MKFEEASLTGYLVDNLKPLTQADPVILAKYVVALLNKDKPSKELQKLCADNLVEFLGNGAKSFTAKLFQALDDGSIVKIDRNLDVIQKLEPSEALPIGGIHPLKNSSLEEVNHSSTSSESSSDPEDKEVSDDDDDRNHKHRRREARPNSLETDTQEQSFRRSNRKRNKPYDNGKRLLDTDLQLSEIHKEYNPSLDRNTSTKFDKRRSDLAPLLRAPIDLGPRTRFSQPFRNDPGPRYDLSTSIGRPVGRGRARSTVPWNQHDSRFNPHDALDFASQMASQGPAHPNLFVGTGLPSAGSTQSSSWGGFGFIPGMSNGIMDPLNPLGLQGALGPSINPPLNLGIPRQRCRDFEERGFCLRGDMCPMEHGLNRIVVEDVQSLSQFNLPVSISNSNALGIQAGSGSVPPASAASGQLANAKITSSKISRSGATEDAPKLNDIPSTSAGVDADVYDPDQPLWNNDRSNASASPLRLPSPNIENDPSWDGDLSAHQSLRSDGIEREVPSRVTGNNSQITGSSVWGRIGSASKSNVGSKMGNMTGTSTLGNEMKENRGEAMDDIHAINQGKGTGMTEIGSKAATIQPFDKSHIGSAHKGGRASTKALRTLYVNCIPQKSNRRDALFSHFQKFGEVIDIYIPLNSEKAFVQFSKREEAEAALKSPDAVMGNRFIKLSWANRDRILDSGQSSGYNTSAQFPFIAKTSAPSKQPNANGGQETPISAQRSTISAAETPISVAAPVKGLTTNSPKPAPPVKKKVESMELLEELRRKQETLAKKRDDFKRQLDKFEKQAISNKKGDMTSEQAAKRHKVDIASEADKAAVPSNLIQVTEKILKKNKSEEVHITNVSKTNSTVLQQSLKNTTSSLQAPLSNRFKLDNRSTSFRILPPLPTDFASVAVIKDHFSQYGVISTVVIEEPGHTENEGLSPSANCSACITFSTRHFAERAYQSGKCWEGHNLQFKWLTVSPNSNRDCGIREPTLSPKIAQKADIQLNLVTSGSSSASAEKSTCSVSELAAVGSVENNRDIEGTNCLPIAQPKLPMDSSPFSPSTSECEKSSFESPNA
ncbi:uncharacterized protein A4U43_C06F5680 [Asparagus officinalis]|uniref:C3H1-type domain-containing protein n=1 Tax=Asparagus officinalis TaxID=4686 RepID=A0A5P1ENW0_ASPOF|nr:zinc finger CCCH domain-containing protein 27 [Asparagus officinalis]ONK66241.1 uncharacterized protein A4U43_C06F5680 [Asparagus officinalis]